MRGIDELKRGSRQSAGLKTTVTPHPPNNVVPQCAKSHSNNLQGYKLCVNILSYTSTLCLIGAAVAGRALLPERPRSADCTPVRGRDGGREGWWTDWTLICSSSSSSSFSISVSQCLVVVTPRSTSYVTTTFTFNQTQEKQARDRVCLHQQKWCQSTVNIVISAF